MDWFGPDLTMPVHLLRWTTFLGWTSPIEIMDHSIWPFRSILNPSTSLFCNFHVQNGGKHLSLQLLWTFTRLFRPVMIHWHHEIFKPQLGNFGSMDCAQEKLSMWQSFFDHSIWHTKDVSHKPSSQTMFYFD